MIGYVSYWEVMMLVFFFLGIEEYVDLELFIRKLYYLFGFGIGEVSLVVNL